MHAQLDERQSKDTNTHTVIECVLVVENFQSKIAKQCLTKMETLVRTKCNNKDKHMFIIASRKLKENTTKIKTNANFETENNSNVLLIALIYWVILSENSKQRVQD